MRGMIFVLSMLIAAAASSWSSPAAAATPSCNTAPCPVAYVSMNGYSIAINGANACVMPTATQPVGCSTFADALASVSPGGTIVILDAGQYEQSVSITQSVTIVSPLGASIVPPSGSPAISVNGAGVRFGLRGVILDGISGGTAGVIATNASSVTIHKVLIKAFTGSGVVPGIEIDPSSGVTILVDIEESHIIHNTFGIVASGTSGGSVEGAVNGSIVDLNNQNGITASTTSSSVVLVVINTEVLGNGNHGLAVAGSNAGMLVRSTKVFGNAAGLFAESGGALLSYGNNSVNGNNGNDGTFTGTVSQQ
jgi:hypothetical protein